MGYYQGGFQATPHLVFELINSGRQAVTFTVAANHYAREREQTFRVPARGRLTRSLDSFVSDGWYDVSVTITGDHSWTRRYVGHLEDGSHSVTG